ncbi:heme biosynthesis protein HemY [Arenibacterium halophilum]|uniref:Tetratricopeptide repeat protein n=1 Tax=Arenibacterium halophilum TaxID=2583821 RepID=A0ABY2X5P5_9RHOB|nr:heme biosynthesis HemY N-terminal domain-containing protein [Arenibacterium halophilum]TMV10776.1 tetratricopeptide repeat protein [Arenibacterium halophilum]
MLWSLIKILVFVAIVAALAIGASILLETSGGVQVTVAGTEYTLGPLQSVIAIVVLVVAVWVLLKILSLCVAILRFISGDETAISRYFSRGRERKGYQALADGLMALASGEGRVAMNKAARAERYLHKPELTNLLTAQAAEMAGDRHKATESYKRLIEDDKTRFVGVRGIMKQKLAEGDTETARKLAEKAFALKPRHAETQDVLLRLQAQAHDWAGARSTLSAKLKSGTLPRDVYTRREAVLALSEAHEVLDENSSIDAREQAIEANRLSPDLVPAAAMAARAYVSKGKPKNATRLLRKAWDAQPHPDLAAAFAEIEPNESPQERIRRFTVLTKTHPDHPETRLLLAELYVVAEDFPEARRALGDLAEPGKGDARALTLMAAIERGEGASDGIVRAWLARALEAPRGPQWVCENCHTIHSAWMPVCSNCEALDTLAWKTPPRSEVQGAVAAHVLPLLVGQPDPAPEPEPMPDSKSDDIPEAELVDTIPRPEDPLETQVSTGAEADQKDDKKAS